jgi:hypothetical protein
MTGVREAVHAVRATRGIAPQQAAQMLDTVAHSHYEHCLYGISAALFARPAACNSEYGHAVSHPACAALLIAAGAPPNGASLALVAVAPPEDARAALDRWSGTAEFDAAMDDAPAWAARALQEMCGGGLQFAD